MKPYLDTFIDGRSACVFCHGPTGSGKTWTLFGGDNQSGGLLTQSAEYIIQSKIFKASAIEITNTTMYDVSGGKKFTLKDAANQKPNSITSMNDFSSFLSNILKNRSQRSTDQNMTSSRSHLMITLTFDEFATAKMAFVDLAGSENPNNKENLDETKFINGTLSGLNGILSKISRQEFVTFSTPLTKLIKPYLSGQAQSMMLYHVPNKNMIKSLECIKDIVPSSKTEKRKLKAFSDITNNKRMHKMP